MLKAGRMREIDVPNLVEEIESLARAELAQLEDEMEAILCLLVEGKYEGLLTAQHKIELILRDSPSLKSRLAENVQAAWDAARIIATNELDRPLPLQCPFTIGEVLGNFSWEERWNTTR